MTWRRLNKAAQLRRGQGGPGQRPAPRSPVPGPRRRGLALLPPLPGPEPGTRDPGTRDRTPGAGSQEGIRRLRALGKFPGRCPSAGSPSGVQRRAPRAGACGSGRAAHARTPPEVHGPPRRTHAPRARPGPGREPRAPPGRGPGTASGGEKPARCPLSGSGRGPTGRSPESPRGARRQSGRTGPSAPRGRRTPLPRPWPPRGTGSLRSSSSSAPASQAAAASIALPAAAAARHCAPGPARRGHMLRRRPGRSDPRRGPARRRPWAAGRRVPRVPSCAPRDWEPRNAAGRGEGRGVGHCPSHRPANRASSPWTCGVSGCCGGLAGRPAWGRKPGH